MKKKFNLSMDIYIGLSLFILSLINYIFIIPTQIKVVHYGSYGLSPFVFPKIATLGITVFSAILVITGILGLSKDKNSSIVSIEHKTWIIMLFLIGYLFLINFIGFLIASGVFLFTLMMYLNHKNWLKYIIIILFFVLVNYIFFERLLKIVLPKGSLFQ